MNLKDMSADALEQLAKKATALAADLRKAEPSMQLALESGIRDCGYQTVRHGWVRDYRGEAIITMADGKKWRAVGHEPCGDAYSITRQGWIEMIPMQPNTQVQP